MTSYNLYCNRQIGGDEVADSNRTEYFRNRRKSMKQIVFLVDKEKAAALDKKLIDQGIGRTEWFRQKMDEEIGK